MEYVSAILAAVNDAVRLPQTHTFYAGNFNVEPFHGGGNLGYEIHRIFAHLVWGEYFSPLIVFPLLYHFCRVAVISNSFSVKFLHFVILAHFLP